MAMKRLQVKVQDEALGKFMAANPFAALSELIWNSLDADAREVRVEFEEEDGSGRISRIVVRDDGHGINETDLRDGFENLGKSWKRHASCTRELGRDLHGSGGQGRYQAFALGQLAEWHTKFKNEHGNLMKFKIEGKKSHPREFEYSEFEPAKGKTGTTVFISNVTREATALKKASTIDKFHKIFALYLKQYPGTPIVEINGQILDPSKVINGVYDHDLTVQDGKGQSTIVHLSIVEWTFKTDKEIHLCNDKGFSLVSHEFTLKSGGIHLTAYIRSPWITELTKANQIELFGVHEFGKLIQETVIQNIQNHIGQRLQTESIQLLEQLKKQNIYPYHEAPKDVTESLERKVFDEVALHVHRSMPEFGNTPLKSQRLSLRLIKEALERDPDSLTTILHEIIGLSKDQQREFAELLEITSLPSVLSASKTIGDRLLFLDGLDFLLFDKENKKALKERKQLHKLIERHTWIFGEAYALTVSDKHLNRVLEKHKKILGRDSLGLDPVTTSSGENPGIVDLMLSRQVRHQDPAQLEHIIVELKRPKVPVSRDVLGQLDKYAQAVALDERFHSADQNVKWQFWAISNELSDDVRLKARQKGRPRGLVEDYEEINVQIWVKTWRDVIDECRGRMRFYKEQLEYQPNQERALAYLRSINPEYLPERLRSEHTA